MDEKEKPDATPSDPSQWVDRHSDALFGYAMLQLGNQEEAQERLQETFLAALQARSTFRGESSERTWLMGILKHKIIDQFRRRKRDSSLAGSEEGELAMKNIFSDKGYWKHEHKRNWADHLDSQAEYAEFLLALELCLAKLPDRMSEAFSLREIQGLKADRICEILGISATNLWTLLHRARALLRDCLDRNWFGQQKQGQQK